MHLLGRSSLYYIYPLNTTAMKRLFTLFIATFLALGTLSAQQADHFTFKGIPIDGSLSAFGNQLVAEGFTKVGTNAYRGKFLRNECLIALVGDDDNMIWRVAAIFPASDTWSVLESSFNGYVDLYSEKYGRPTTIKKEFNTYTGDNPGLKMLAVNDGECNYFAVWNLPQGSIEVRIVKTNKYKEGAIRVVYTDNANKDSVRKSDLEEI